MALANQLGLSTKVVSERHHHASNTKLTAGEAAKELKKKGLLISAKDLVKGFTLLTGREPEWHHSGFYSGGRGKTMGRTFFFSETDIEMVFNDFSKIDKIIKEKEQERIRIAKTQVTGFYYIWENDYNGKHGRKRNFKRLCWYKGSELQKPNNFTSCSEDFYNDNCHKNTAYYGWEEPLVNNI